MGSDTAHNAVMKWIKKMNDKKIYTVKVECENCGLGQSINGKEISVPIGQMISFTDCPNCNTKSLKTHKE